MKIERGGDETHKKDKTKRSKQMGLAKSGQMLNLSEFRRLLEFMRSKLFDVEGLIDKDLMLDARKEYSAVSIMFLRQVGDQGGDALLNVLRGHVHGDEDEYLEYLQKIKVVKTGVVFGGYSCDLDCYNDKMKEIDTLKLKRRVFQRYVAAEMYCGQKDRYSYVIIGAGKGENEKSIYWVGQVRGLFSHVVSNETKEFAIIRYMEPVKPLDELEESLGCAIFRWSTDDEVDYTLERKSFNPKQPPSPWFDVIETNQILSVVQMIRLRYLVKSEKENHWSMQRYALNRFMKIEMHLE
ncbi:MAG: hypothetical protein AAGH46_09755 [Bacteroidota bacterium]